MLHLLPRCIVRLFTGVIPDGFRRLPLPRSVLATLVLLAQLIAPTVSHAAAGWDAQFALAGLDGTVRATAFDSAGNLYVGGNFSTAGNLNVNGIARWDGSSWSALGAGVEGVVSSLAFDSSDNLYAGGSFVTAGGVTANRIARWDGSSWSALGTGLSAIPSGLNLPFLSHQASSLAFDSGGNLYVGGYFSSAGGLSANNIARWDGSSWSALSTGLDGKVESLAIDSSGNLYVGGAFTTAGGVSANNIARWNGSSWSALGNGMNGGISRLSVNSLAFDSSGNLYAGGDFTFAGGVTANHIARWDGSSWSALLADLDEEVNSLAFDSSGNLYAGGDFTTAGGVSVSKIARWDGSNWSALGTGLDQEFRNVASLAIDSNDNLYIGGFFTSIGGLPAHHIALWDGSSWSVLDIAGIYNGLDGPVWATAVDSVGNLYAGGSFTIAGDVSAINIARWDGSNWSALSTGMSGGAFSSVRSLAFDSGGNLYAGGHFTTAGGVSANHIARWNGSSWSALGTGMSGGLVFDLVESLAFVNGSLYAGGDFTTAGGVSANHIARWNGSSWSALGTGMSDVVNSLAFDSGGNLYAGGPFLTAGGVSVDSVARWDGSNWSRIGTGITGFSSALTLAIDSGDNLYLGGRSGGGGGTNVVRWDGSSWSVLASTIGSGSAVMNSLAFDSSGNLYAGGRFYNVTAGTYTNHIARWDGSSWSALGAGLSYEVFSLAFDSGGSLYAGGSFSSAGGKLSSNIARWTPPSSIAPPTLDSPVPGSTLSGTSESFSWSGTGVDEWWLYLGSSAGDLDLYNSLSLGSATTTTVTGLPTDGSTVHATLLYRQGGTWLSVASSYTAANSGGTPAISSPVAGSTLSGSSESFSWSGTGVDEWWLYLGSSSGNLDLYNSLSLGSATTATVTGLPTDGSTVHATLFYKQGGSWLNVASSYTAASSGGTPAISSPASGSTLSGSSETFSWTAASGATSYRVWLGSTSGGDEYGRLASTGTSATSNNLPTDGSTVYATLKWFDASWNTEPTVSYTAFSAAMGPTITNPVAGSTLSGSTETFQWTAASGAMSYRVWLGSTSGGDEYGRLASTGTVATSSALPTDGSTVYATLKWFDVSRNTWNTEPTVSYTAFSATAAAAITSPVAGSTLNGSTETFQWTAVTGATSYRVWLGSTSGGDEYGRIASNGTSATSSALPTDGSTVYATLKWFDGSWNTEPTVSYTAFSAAMGPSITSPAAGSTLSGSTETFQWTAASGATSYRVWLGSTSGGDEYGRVASMANGTGTSAVVHVLPTDGSTVYATLKWFDGSWNTEPTVSYTAFSATAEAAITSPVAGSTLSGSTETFQWTTASGATSYRVWLGSTSGGDEYGRLASNGTSAISNALPTDGSTVYATLKWYDGSWHTEPSVSYTAFSATAAAAITSPVAGSTLSGSTETFQWTTASGATSYRVWLGSTSGGDEYDRIASNGTSAISSALPTDGSTVYATLKWFDGTWHTETSVSYTASSVVSVFTSPAAGITLSGGSATFQWNAIASATTYRVWLGSTPGGDEYGRSASNSTSVTAGGIPTDGNTVYATLKWFNGSWNTEPSVSYSTGP